MSCEILRTVNDPDIYDHDFALHETPAFYTRRTRE